MKKQYSRDIESTLKLCAALMDELNNKFIFDPYALLMDEETREQKIYRLCIDLQEKAGDLAESFRRELDKV